jgi:hypothetical protein
VHHSALDDLKSHSLSVLYFSLGASMFHFGLVHCSALEDLNSPTLAMLHIGLKALCSTLVWYIIVHRKTSIPMILCSMLVLEHQFSTLVLVHYNAMGTPNSHALVLLHFGLRVLMPHFGLGAL